ncbi:hypothetical protein BDSB_06295 [Burkholderia dolosa PC543]|nr:hypothetical protein BDSB_06295 [Burkholderia dolosa PC543]
MDRNALQTAATCRLAPVPAARVLWMYSRTNVGRANSRACCRGSKDALPANQRL